MATSSSKKSNPETASGSGNHGLRSATGARVNLAKRPNYGSLGDPVTIVANHYLIEFSTKKLYHYDVTISPDAPRGLNRAVINELVAQYRQERFRGALPAYDGQKSLFTAAALSSEQVEFDVTLPDEPHVPGRTRPSFHVILREASRIDLEHLRLFLEGSNLSFPQEAVQALDIVLREASNKIFLPGGKSFFDELFGRQSLGNGIEAWKGFYQSIRPAQNGKLVLNIDISANAFLEPDLLPDYIAKAFREDANDIDSEMLRPDSRADSARVKLRRLLKGVRIQLTYGKRRKYRIQSITDVPLAQLSFDYNGRSIRVSDYFKQRYNYKLILQGLPAIQVGTKEQPMFIPMELCRIIRGQRYTRKLNEHQVEALLKLTCSNPADRKRETDEIARRSQDATDSYAEEFGITVNRKMAEISARVIHSPKILYGNRQEVSATEGSWKLTGKTMYKSSSIQNWALINFSAHLPDRCVEQFTSHFVKSCDLSGLNLNPRMTCRWITERYGNVGKAVQHVCAQALERTGNPLDLLICIIPTTADNKSIYGALKKLCDVELGLMTQCLKASESLKKCVPAYIQNIILKINVKLGGKNSMLVDRLAKVLPFISEVPSIIIGADVSHPRVGDDQSPSIAAVVASMDWPQFSRYETLTRSQSHRTEILEDLFWERMNERTGKYEAGGVLMDLLKSFERATGKRPQRIVYYRDGVSDGQFEAVLRQELASVKGACRALGWGSSDPDRDRDDQIFKKQRSMDNTAPKITFIVVQKRHHTRLFPSDHKKTRIGNILPGTVVDSVICHPTNFDFFLCSHVGVQGTSRPAHYHVLHDEIGFSADDIQQLTNDLCFTYARCPRAVSIVPACYYAHLAAARARVWIDNQDTSDGGGSREDVGSNNAGNSKPGRHFRGLSGTRGDVRPLPAVNERLRNLMYFI